MESLKIQCCQIALVADWRKIKSKTVYIQWCNIVSNMRDVISMKTRMSHGIYEKLVDYLLRQPMCRKWVVKPKH